MGNRIKFPPSTGNSILGRFDWVQVIPTPSMVMSARGTASATLPLCAREGPGQGRQEQQGGAEALCGSHGDQPAECLRARNSSFLTLIYPNPCSIPRCRTPCGNGPSNPHARLKVRDQISDDQALRQANRRLDRLTINPLRNTTSGRNRLRYGLCVGTKALLNGSGGVSAGGRELKGWKGAAVVTAGNL